MLNEIKENAFIAQLVEHLPRSPLLCNKTQASDAELLRLPGLDGAFLAITTDSLVEELESGLYADPFLIGWMTVIVNASDLAAVGAEPLGILLSETLPPDGDAAFVGRLQEGIREACLACQLPVLGGDTNFSARLQMGGCTLGMVRSGKPLTRRGCRPGDVLFSSGHLGSGSAYAFARLAGDPRTSNRSFPYQPMPRLREGRLLAPYASCCMDTSDGALATLDQLMRLNGVGFVLESSWEAALDANARDLARSLGFPPWSLLAGPHGEFELLFTIPAERCNAFQAAAAALNWQPLPLGRVAAETAISIAADGKLICLNTCKMRNLFADVNGDVARFIRELLRLVP